MGSLGPLFDAGFVKGLEAGRKECTEFAETVRKQAIASGRLEEELAEARLRVERAEEIVDRVRTIRDQMWEAWFEESGERFGVGDWYEKAPQLLRDLDEAVTEPPAALAADPQPAEAGGEDDAPDPEDAWGIPPSRRGIGPERGSQPEPQPADLERVLAEIDAASDYDLAKVDTGPTTHQDWLIFKYWPTIRATLARERELREALREALREGFEMVDSPNWMGDTAVEHLRWLVKVKALLAQPAVG